MLRYGFFENFSFLTPRPLPHGKMSAHNDDVSRYTILF
jgi:hypothetical protein